MPITEAAKAHLAKLAEAPKPSKVKTKRKAKAVTVEEDTCRNIKQAAK